MPNPYWRVCWHTRRPQALRATHNNVAPITEEGLKQIATHFKPGSKGTSEGNLLTNGWRCDSKKPWRHPQRSDLQIWLITAPTGAEGVGEARGSLEQRRGGK